MKHLIKSESKCSNYRFPITVLGKAAMKKILIAYTQEMALFNDPLVDDWSIEDVIYEIAINEEGYGLNCRIELLENICVNTVYSVTDFDKEQAFKICLDDAIDPELPKKLNLDIQDRFICRDVALNDEQTANLALQCRLKNI